VAPQRMRQRSLSIYRSLSAIEYHSGVMIAAAKARIRSHMAAMASAGFVISLAGKAYIGVTE